MTKRGEIGLRLGASALLLLPVFVLVVAFAGMERRTCLQAWPDDPVRWGPVDGCQVQVEGHWIQASFLESFMMPVDPAEREMK